MNILTIGEPVGEQDGEPDEGLSRRIGKRIGQGNKIENQNGGINIK
jgi:hypothetical protein